MTVFTARRYVGAIYAVVCPSVRQSVCLMQAAKLRITQITSHDSPGTLSFPMLRYSRNSISNRVTVEWEISDNI